MQGVSLTSVCFGGYGADVGFASVECLDTQTVFGLIVGYSDT